MSQGGIKLYSPSMSLKQKVVLDKCTTSSKVFTRVIASCTIMSNMKHS